MEGFLCSVCSTREGEPIVLCSLCAHLNLISLYCHRCHSRHSLTLEQAHRLFPQQNEIRPGLVLRFESDCLLCHPAQIGHYRVFSIEGQLINTLPIEV